MVAALLVSDHTAQIRRKPKEIEPKCNGWEEISKGGSNG